MNTCSRTAVKILAAAGAMSLPALVNAAIYSPPRLTHVAASTDGSVYMKWSGSPNPGPCGANSGWVKIPATSDESIKALAFSIYFGGTPARVDTSGCDG